MRSRRVRSLAFSGSRGEDAGEREAVATFARSQLQSIWARLPWIAGVLFASASVALTVVIDGDVNVIPGVAVLIVWSIFVDRMKTRLQRAVMVNSDNDKPNVEVDH